MSDIEVVALKKKSKNPRPIVYLILGVPISNTSLNSQRYKKRKARVRRRARKGTKSLKKHNMKDR